MIITQKKLSYARSLIARGRSDVELAYRLQCRMAELPIVRRSLRARLRYGEPAPVVLSDDQIRARQAALARQEAA